jgi:hypothetical protein
MSRARGKEAFGGQPDLGQILGLALGADYDSYLTLVLPSKNKKFWAGSGWSKNNF